MSDTAFSYVGQELDIFSHARNWKRYWVSSIAPWVRGDVLEVGAGIGANTPFLQNPRVSSWTCLEPDPKLAQRLAKAIREDERCSHCDCRARTTADLIGTAEYDCLLYIDVLEHIEHDRDELERSARLLRKGGSIVVLSPAHQFLFSPFDAAIGHYRRYNRESLTACGPESLKLKSMFYLDSVGFFASAANRFLLSQSYPTLKQIQFWDNVLVPLSRVADLLLFRRAGKTIVGVWER